MQICAGPLQDAWLPLLSQLQTVTLTSTSLTGDQTTLVRMRSALSELLLSHSLVCWIFLWLSHRHH